MQSKVVHKGRGMELRDIQASVVSGDRATSLRQHSSASGTAAARLTNPRSRRRRRPLVVPGRLMRLEDVEMDAAAIGAAHGPILASGTAADHAEHGEIAVAFRA